MDSWGIGLSRKLSVKSETEKIKSAKIEIKKRLLQFFLPAHVTLYIFSYIDHKKPYVVIETISAQCLQEVWKI